jgi:hypothetical protein
LLERNDLMLYTSFPEEIQNLILSFTYRVKPNKLLSEICDVANCKHELKKCFYYKYINYHMYSFEYTIDEMMKNVQGEYIQIAYKWFTDSLFLGMHKEIVNVEKLSKSERNELLEIAQRFIRF